MKRLELRNLNLRGRSKEFTILEDAYGRVKDSSCTSCEIVMVTGCAGTGKSSLVNKLKSKVQQDDPASGFFVSGKFDQQKTTEPYHALAAALDELCHLIVASGDKDRTRASFLEKVGSKGKLLLDIMPKLNQLVGDLDGESIEHVPQRRSTTTFHQLKYVLRAFVRTVCSVTLRPVILFLDDLQWADASSLELLESLIMDSESKRILFVGSYRDDEVDEKHPLAAKLRNIGNEKQIRSIQLQNLDLDSVNEILSGLTGLDPSSTKPLAEVVHKKTHGNIFYLVQFLQMLQDEDLLYFSIKTYKWAWDSDKIKTQTNLSDNVVELVKDKIQRLAPETQAAMQLAACLWSTFDVALLREVMMRGMEKSEINGKKYKDIMNSEEDIESFLDPAAEEGLLDKLNGARYKFAHDRIRQAAYSLISEGREQESFHHWIGEVLLEMTKAPRCGAWVYFAAADQLNLGAALVTDKKRRVELAKLNLVVGERAMSLSAFVPAISYLNAGISHLPAQVQWTQHYSLTMRLHNALAEMEHCAGNWERMQEVSDVILANAKCFEDKISAYHTVGLSLMSQSRNKEVVELCNFLLGELGEPLPRRVTNAAVALEGFKLKRLLNGKSDEDILQLPLMAEEKKLHAARFHGLMLNSMLYLMSPKVSLVAIRMVNLALRFGLYEDAPLAFVFWGDLVKKKGNLQEGYRYGKLALKLVGRFNSKITKTRVVCYADSFLIHWKEPLQNTLDTLMDAHKTGMLNGDITFAFQCITAYQLHYFATGLPLSSGAEDMIAFHKQMQEYKQESCRRMLAPVLQMILNLMGRSKNSLRLTGEIMDQDEAENVETNPSRIGVQSIASCRMQLAYYFGDLDLAFELSSKLQSISNDSLAAASFVVCVRVMFFGLVTIALARKTKKRKHRADAQRIISIMEDKWVKCGAVNCLHKVLLLKAEYATLKTPNNDAVREAFDAAISTARRIGFINDEALANERAGEFFLQRGDGFWASSYLSRAHALYGEWGAQAKVDQLEKTHGVLLAKREANHVSHLKGRTRFTEKSAKTHKTLDSNQIYNGVG